LSVDKRENKKYRGVYLKFKEVSRAYPTDQLNETGISTLVEDLIKFLQEEFNFEPILFKKIRNISEV